uniref:SUMO-interacting motif-containing protein 1 n=1 Tax=Leptobrachium leishanense TaxID=445787 RepID=A0A8C5N206_9ANUR
MLGIISSTLSGSVGNEKLTQDIIDLTDDGSDVEIIDLTGTPDTVDSPFDEVPHNDLMDHKWIKPESLFNYSTVPKDRLSRTINSEEKCWSCPSEEMNTTRSDSPAITSDQDSLGNSSNYVIEQNGYSTRNNLYINQGFQKPSPIPNTHSLHPSPLHSYLTTTNPAVLCSPTDSTCFLKASSPSRSPALPVTSNSSNNATSETTKVDKSWRYKLRYFNEPPVHLFTRRLNHISQARQPIPARQMNIVDTTIEENFPQATLNFLFEFVSVSRYPSKEILCYIVKSILLGGEDPGNKNEAYNLLMKVQDLHPAKLDTVAWDWDLLTEVMNTKDSSSYLLFLQYVVQTLHDDFHSNLRRRVLQRCLAKSMLSCDQSFCKIKDLINWLIVAVQSSCKPRNCDAAFDSEREVPLLQRMLSIAVDLDNSPACSSNRIADYIFPFVIAMETRPEREMFLNSIESHLLRAKILDLIFTHSCQSPVDRPLSVAKILCFIKHSTLDLRKRGLGEDWQRWDEMLHYICLLFFSFQRITSDNLLTPVIDRIDAPVTHTQNQTMAGIEDVQSHFDSFLQRISDGKEVPPVITDRLKMLQHLLCAAVRHQQREDSS